MNTLINSIVTLAGSNVTPGTATSQGGISTVGDNSNTLIENITNIINGIVAVLGMVCVVVIIIGGVNYMTSAGDSGKVKKAKDTILYGVIGMVVCILAFAIVNFILSGIIAG